MKGILCEYLTGCYTRGWISPRDGNLSFKGAGEDLYYITPAGINKSKIAEEDVLKIRISDDKVLENKNNRKPSGEQLLHTMILKDPMNIDRNVCVVHCHPPHILAYVGLMKTDKELSTIKEYFPELSEDILIGPNVGHITARTEKLAIMTYMNIKNKSIVALKQHGVVATGNNFEDIMELIETLEYYCRIYLLSKE